ncbi:hypothetical protein G5B37_08530 [Rasiella rasia]|uniref:Uncharacterized protein n=1 Tax=Rasiella rasia TaxID=2744027 RepID=A0A6G6GLY9_9FLAO|nr:hypothetical protein [Rasiella rasia]QIE59606.1 hypothetical protein G5B37_08530 [Rasiella rasia]
MKYVITCILLLIVATGLSQIPTRSSGSVSTGSNIDVLDANRFTISKITTAPSEINYKEIEGTPYINNNTGANNYLPIGKFYTPAFEYMETAFARYNAHTDMMEVSLLDNGVDYYLLKKEPDFLYIVLKDKTYRAYVYNNSMGYFVILSKDDTQACTLLKKERVVFKKAEKASSSFVTSSPDSFKKLRDVYYLKINNSLFEVPKKKKLFYQLFRNQAAAVERYAKNNGLKINREQDLLEICRYYNTLTP